METAAQPETEMTNDRELLICASDVATRRPQQLLSSEAR